MDILSTCFSNLQKIKITLTNDINFIQEGEKSNINLKIIEKPRRNQAVRNKKLIILFC